MRIAIVGAGIAGLSSSWLLTRQGHAVTLFESAPRAGGHTHTVDVTLDGVTHPVDTGFLVFNDRTYPRLIELFDALGVTSVASDMSFSVRHDAARIEWAGTNWGSLFARPSNACSPRFWWMLADVARFNHETTRLVHRNALPGDSLGEFLDRRGYGAPFRDWYLLPMASAIWSSPPHAILDFPIATFARFCHNHGLLSLRNRPQWRTVSGGGREYVRRILATLQDVRLACPVMRITRRPGGIDVDSDAKLGERFDAIVLACHSDQALQLLGDTSQAETRHLSQIRYQPNRVVLHTDRRLMPASQRAWSSWNYLATVGARSEARVSVSYLINKLQPLPFRHPVIATLNPPFEPLHESVLGTFDYSHPLLDRAAIAAQASIAMLQGQRRTWFAGAWLGYGFHEDGLVSAHAVADAIRTASDPVDGATQRKAA